MIGDLLYYRNIASYYYSVCVCVWEKVIIKETRSRLVGSGFFGVYLKLGLLHLFSRCKTKTNQQIVRGSTNKDNSGKFNIQICGKQVPEWRYPNQNIKSNCQERRCICWFAEDRWVCIYVFVALSPETPLSWVYISSSFTNSYSRWLHMQPWHDTGTVNSDFNCQEGNQ